MPGYVYILRSLKNGRYYIGCSENPDERLRFHNCRKVKSTKLLVPWEIVHLMKFQTITEAKKEEYRIKSMKSRIYIEKLMVRAPR